MNCIFCKIVNGDIPSYKLYEDNDILAFLDINPVSAGHTLIIPKKHILDIMDIDDILLTKIVNKAKDIANVQELLTQIGLMMEKVEENIQVILTHHHVNVVHVLKHIVNIVIMMEDMLQALA